MNFIVGAPPSAPEPSTAFLVPDNWDDWFSFRTMFDLIVFDENGQRYDIGAVKIGELGLAADGTASPGKRAPTLPEHFHQLEETHFSLGQTDNYYESLSELRADVRTAILSALRDCAYNLSIYRQHENEAVMRTSLLRSLTESRVTQRFHRLAHGNAALTDYHFEYSFPAVGDAVEPPRLSFQVTPLSEPPTNIQSSVRAITVCWRSKRNSAMKK